VILDLLDVEKDRARDVSLGKFGVRVARDIRQEIGPVDDADRGIAQGGEPFGRNESSSFASSD